jgi:hypothetical protein
MECRIVRVSAKPLISEEILNLGIPNDTPAMAFLAYGNKMNAWRLKRSLCIYVFMYGLPDFCWCSIHGENVPKYTNLSAKR